MKLNNQTWSDDKFFDIEYFSMNFESFKTLFGCSIAKFSHYQLCVRKKLILWIISYHNTNLVYKFLERPILIFILNYCYPTILSPTIQIVQVTSCHMKELPICLWQNRVMNSVTVMNSWENPAIFTKKATLCKNSVLFKDLF